MKPTIQIFIFPVYRAQKAAIYLLHILSQSSNATLFYFDNIFVQTNALGRMVRLNESSFSWASELTLVLTICLKLFKKQSIPLRKGG